MVFHRNVFLVKSCGLATPAKKLWVNIFCYELMISKELGQFHTEWGWTQSVSELPQVFFLRPPMFRLPFLQGYFATEFQVAFHWVTRLLNLIVTAPVWMQLSPFSSSIPKEPHSQSQQLRCTAQSSLFGTTKVHHSSFLAVLFPRYFRSEQLTGCNFWQRQLMVTPHLCVRAQSSLCASIRLRGATRSPPFWDFQPPLGKTLSNWTSF